MAGVIRDPETRAKALAQTKPQAAVTAPGLTALLDQPRLQLHTHELHDHLNEIQNSTTQDLPLSDSDFETLHTKHARKNEVKEPAALYAIR